MEIFDISRLLSNDLAPWPGDTAFHFALTWKMAEGAAVNVGKVEMGVHNGTHADALFHFQPSGLTIDQLPLEAFVGPAVVVDVTNKFSAGKGHVNVADLLSAEEALRGAPRLLLKTNVWTDTTVFPKTIPTIAREVTPWLQARGVKLLGLDLPSVDAIDAKDMANHHALAAAGIAIVESLDLSRVAAGLYRFAALPLKIAGGDGAPVRAILWRE
jgi:arylformamidase